MVNKKLHVYCASGWFNENDVKVLSEMEEYLQFLQSKGLITIHRPRIDGIELKPGEFHDPSLRKKVFECNVDNINKADVVIANLTTSSSSRYDTGTVWEVGYAVRSGKHVIVIDDGARDSTGLHERLSDLLEFPSVEVVFSVDTAMVRLMNLVEVGTVSTIVFDTVEVKKSRPVVFLPTVAGEEYDTLVEVSQEVCGRYVSFASNFTVAESIIDLVSQISEYEYIVVPISQKNSIFVFLMGVAYAAGIPIISYSAIKDGINLMLVASVNMHVVGKDELITCLETIKRTGINSLPEFTGGDFKVY